MKKKRWVLIISIIIVVLVLGIIAYFLFDNYQKEQKRLKEIEQKKAEEKLVQEINSHYGQTVAVSEDTDIFILEKGKYKVAGKVYSDTVLGLAETKIDAETKYFQIASLDKEYYIESKYTVPTEEEIKQSSRYLNYIPYNRNIVTKSSVTFYDTDKKLYTINQSFNLPIYMVDGDKYYVEYNHQLMYVLREDIEQIVASENSNAEIATGIATIAYHFIYDPQNESCNEQICHPISQVQSHIDYLKQNSYFTPTMKEFELWIDGKLQLPKNSVMITVDDGPKAENASKIFTDNQINASIFVVSSWFDPNVFVTDYVEVHSHSFNLHNAYACPGYGSQGGGIMCLPKETLLADLKESRERTNMTTAFCYPFYDYNDYSIQVLKEAGFTMAFAGAYANGKAKMTVGADKFKIPRFTMINTSSVDYLASILNNY